MSRLTPLESDTLGVGRVLNRPSVLPVLARVTRRPGPYQYRALERRTP